MIREILEQQGILQKMRIDMIQPIHLGGRFIGDIVVLDNKYTGVGKSGEEAKEQACRQYVRENGFKLEWLKKYVKHIYDIDIFVSGKNLIKELTYKFVQDGLDMFKGNKCINVLMNYTNDKLIAWLYANDIEIKE